MIHLMPIPSNINESAFVIVLFCYYKLCVSILLLTNQRQLLPSSNIASLNFPIDKVLMAVVIKD